MNIAHSCDVSSSHYWGSNMAGSLVWYYGGKGNDRRTVFYKYNCAVKVHGVV